MPLTGSRREEERKKSRGKEGLVTGFQDPLERSGRGRQADITRMERVSSLIFFCIAQWLAEILALSVIVNQFLCDCKRRL